MLWKVLYLTLYSIFGIGGLVMQGFGLYFDIIQATQTPQFWGVSILHIGIVSFTLVAISVIAQLRWHIHRIEAPIGIIVQKLKRETIMGFSLLEIFDALRDRFTLGLTGPEVHDVLRAKLNRDAVWGIYSSDIITKFSTLGLIYWSSIDSDYPHWLNITDRIPNHVYGLTDIGNQLGRKLMSQKLKIDKKDSRKQ